MSERVKKILSCRATARELNAALDQLHSSNGDFITAVIGGNTYCVRTVKCK